MGDNSALEHSFGPRDLFSAVSQAANRSDIGILITDWNAEPKVLYVNEALAALAGHQQSELLNSSPWLLLAASELGRLQGLYDERVHGNLVPQKFNSRLLHASGREIPVEISATPVGVAGAAMTVFFILDVSEQQRATEELRNSEARFAQLLDSAPDGVLMLQQTRILSANHLAASMFGREDPATLVGLELPQLLETASAAVTENALSRLSTLQRYATDDETNELMTLDGRSLEVSAIDLDYEGQHTVLAFLRDVTERKAIQRRLVQADRLAAVGMLAAGVAHEVNNPLAYVLLNLEYLQRELPKVAHHPERLENLMKHLEDASHGAQRVQSIVRDLRSFAPADDDGRQPVELNSIVESAAAMAAHELSQRGVLTKEFDEVVYVCAVAAKLEQVFLNILMNAVQALDPNQSDNQVHIHLRRHADGNVLVTIADTGTGIPPALRDKVFEPFFTTKPRGLGTGLGLPICRNIVASFDGRLWITDNDRGGTSVHVELTAVEAPDAPAPVPPPPASAAYDEARRKVLIIDDEKSVATMLARFLEPSYDVSQCTRALDALELLREHTFDVILCDIMMPEMSGIDLFEQLKHISPGSQDRVIFMTGGGLLPEVYAFLHNAERPKIEKPFDLRELRRVIQEMT